MAAWMRAWTAAASASPSAPTATDPARVPAGLQGQVIDVLVAMALTIPRELSA
jgi:hypothetical protein